MRGWGKVGRGRAGRGRWGHKAGSGQDPAGHSLAGDVPTGLVDHAGSVETAAALIHLTPGPLEVGGAAALPGAVSSHLARAQVLTVARALPCGLVGGQEMPETPPS